MQLNTPRMCTQCWHAGNRTYGGAAARATGAIFGRRSAALGLPGNTVDCDSGDWVRGDSGIGAGLDSYYEYLLKVYPASFIWPPSAASAQPPCCQPDGQPAHSCPRCCSLLSSMETAM